MRKQVGVKGEEAVMLQGEEAGPSEGVHGRLQL